MTCRQCLSRLCLHDVKNLLAHRRLVCVDGESSERLHPEIRLAFQITAQMRGPLIKISQVHREVA